jgi:hypothetical protein
MKLHIDSSSSTTKILPDMVGVFLISNLNAYPYHCENRHLGGLLKSGAVI